MERSRPCGCDPDADARRRRRSAGRAAHSLRVGDGHRPTSPAQATPQRAHAHARDGPTVHPHGRAAAIPVSACGPHMAGDRSCRERDTSVVPVTSSRAIPCDIPPSSGVADPSGMADRDGRPAPRGIAVAGRGGAMVRPRSPADRRPGGRKLPGPPFRCQGVSRPSGLDSAAGFSGGATASGSFGGSRPFASSPVGRSGRFDRSATAPAASLRVATTR